MKTILPITSLILFLLASLRADFVSDAHSLESADLEDLIAYAHRHNPELSTMRERAEASSQRSAQVQSLENPQLMYGYYVQRMNDRQMLSLSQRFPYPGTLRLRGEIAARNADQAGFMTLAVQREIEQRIRIAYAELALLDAKWRLLGESAGLVKRTGNIIRARVQSGQGGAADSLRNQLERSRIEDERSSLLAQRAGKAAALNALLGRPTNAALPPLTDLADYLPSDETSEWDAAMLAGYPELLARERLSDAARASVDLARHEGLPGFSLGVQYMDVAGGRRDEWMLTAGISLPLWRERYRAQAREAQANTRAAESEWRNRRDALAAELTAALQDRADAMRKVQLYRDQLIPQAQRIVETEESAYRANRADLLRVIDAQQLLIDLERSFYQAAATAIRTDAVIDRILPQPKQTSDLQPSAHSAK